MKMYKAMTGQSLKSVVVARIEEANESGGVLNPAAINIK